ncbi:unnamed protein product [Auanema sp. JU1783]|nr:unnamed protein product [Auanema sp. JU1783]
MGRGKNRIPNDREAFFACFRKRANSIIRILHSIENEVKEGMAVSAQENVVINDVVHTSIGTQTTKDGVFDPTHTPCCSYMTPNWRKGLSTIDHELDYAGPARRELEHLKSDLIKMVGPTAEPQLNKFISSMKNLLMLR